MKNVKVRDLKVTTSDEPSDESVAGLATHKYVVRATYRVAGEIQGTPLTVDYGLTAFVWTSDTIDAAAAMPAVDLTTGTADVDAQLAPKFAAIPGFPLKTVLVATSAY